MKFMITNNTFQQLLITFIKSKLLDKDAKDEKKIFIKS